MELKALLEGLKKISEQMICIDYIDEDTTPVFKYNLNFGKIIMPVYVSVN